MSDYLFMLESHLNSDQARVLSEVQSAAAASGCHVFLTGGAMRDMLGGFRIRDLDFTVEGNGLKIARTVAHKSGAKILFEDEERKSAELLFASGVTVEIGMARQEKYAKTGATPAISPATIQDDLRRRDFSINAIAISLNPASRGLLLDPTNGLADLERRELRTLSNYSFYDDPSRLLRLIRLRIRLGFTVEERTLNQYHNAREAHVEEFITSRSLFHELSNIAEEDNPSEILKGLQEAGLLVLFSAALAGQKFDVHALQKLEKAYRNLPPVENAIRVERLGPFLWALTEKLSPKEKAELIKRTDMRKAEIELWQKLEGRAHKLESALKSARIKKPSQVYEALAGAAGDEIVFLLYQSANKTVVERIKNYLHKYLPAVQELSEADFEKIAAKPGSPKYEKQRAAVIADRLDRRPRKVTPPPPVMVEPPQPMRGQRAR